MSTVTIGTLNVHNRASAARFMLTQQCDILGLSEAGRIDELLARARRYRVTVGRGSSDDVRSAGEVPVLTRRMHRSLGSICWQASELTQPERIAPARWVTVAAQHVDGIGPVAAVNVHPNAVTDGRTTAVSRVRESAEFWQSVDRLLVLLRAEGQLVVLMGDVNARKSNDTPGWDGAYDVIRRHKLAAISQGLDVLAYDERLRSVSSRVIARETSGSDHPGIVATLRRRHY